MKKRESIFFLLMVLFHTLPILYYKYFFTIDGPAHLHNALLIERLWFHHAPVLNSFYSFSPFPYPNWMGHLMMIFFNILLPGYLAEKCLQLFLVVGMAYGFRGLLLKTAPENSWMSYLI